VPCPPNDHLQVVWKWPGQRRRPCGHRHRRPHPHRLRFDTNGNQVSGNGRSIIWSSYNKPLEVGKNKSVPLYPYIRQWPGQRRSARGHRHRRAHPHRIRFDTNGNQVSGNGRSITWSSYNKPLEVHAGGATIGMAYGPERQLIRQSRPSGQGGTETVYYASPLFEQTVTQGARPARATTSPPPDRPWR
jgi:hypothetical protein